MHLDFTVLKKAIADEKKKDNINHKTIQNNFIQHKTVF
jgi:hypothetical protein